MNHTWSRGLRAALLCLALAPVAAGAEERPPASLAELQLSFAPAVRAAGRSVVNIYASRLVEERANPFASHPLFQHFFFRNFGTGPLRQQVQNALGSGVLVGADGVVLTAAHVIQGADEIRVVLSDRREFAAEILLADEASDLAVLRLDGAQDLPVLAFRDTDELEVGDFVLAFGNPLGVGQTVTSGIISAIARGDREGRHFVQTDAAINVGNSGGPLTDSSGRLVGINTAIVTRSGGSDGIGFAVPANLARRAVEAAQAGRDALPRPWPGFAAQQINQDLADALGMERPRGLILREIDPRSAFAEAGLEQGDVLLTLGPHAVHAEHELRYRLAVAGPGQELMISYLRGNAERMTTVLLRDAPGRGAEEAIRLGAGAGPFAGVTVADANPALAEEVGVPSVNVAGVLVLRVEGPAQRWLRRGDFVRTIDRAEVPDVAGLRRLLRRHRGDWEIGVERGGRRLVTTLR